MKNASVNSFIGWLCIIFGIIVVVVAAGEILARLLIAILALFLINYGLSLNRISVSRLAAQFWMRRRF